MNSASKISGGHPGAWYQRRRLGGAFSFGHPRYNPDGFDICGLGRYTESGRSTRSSNEVLVNSEQTEGVVRDFKSDAVPLHHILAPAQGVRLPVLKALPEKDFFEPLISAYSGIRAQVPWGVDPRRCQDLSPTTTGCFDRLRRYFAALLLASRLQCRRSVRTGRYHRRLCREPATYSVKYGACSSRGFPFLNLGEHLLLGKGTAQRQDSKQIWRNVARDKYRAVDRPGTRPPKEIADWHSLESCPSLASGRLDHPVGCALAQTQRAGRTERPGPAMGCVRNVSSSPSRENTTSTARACRGKRTSGQ